MAKEETIVSGMAGRYASALHALAAESGATAAVGAMEALLREEMTVQALQERFPKEELENSPIRSAR